jgi:hypothetical protein
MTHFENARTITALVVSRAAAGARS